MISFTISSEAVHTAATLTTRIPDSAGPRLREALEYFVDLAVILLPLFFVASFLVGLTQEYLPPERVEAVLRSHDEGGGNVVAATIGAVTPFCSCSTIPILAGLLQAGAPLGLAFSFLLASPLVNWIAVTLLLGIFGLQITAAYIVVTFFAAVLGGIVIGRLQLDSFVKDIELSTGTAAAVTDGGTQAGSCSTTASEDDACGVTETCCGSALSRSHRERIAAAGGGAWSFLRDLLPYLIVGMFIGGLIYGAPDAWIAGTLGTSNPLIVPIAAVLGAPIYISLSAMLPVAAGLAGQGVPIGTVLAFVIGSAGVSIPNLIILSRLFERTLLAIYVVSVVTIGTLVGLTFNLIFV